MKDLSGSAMVAAAAERVTARYGAHVAALLAYGSRVFGLARAGSAYDFWLIVKDLEAFHEANAEFYRTQLNVKSTPAEQVALNRTGPLFYSLLEDGMSIKLAVLREADFARLCHCAWWTVKGRMQKPLLALRTTPVVDAAILAARREAAACGVNLAGRMFGMEQLLYQVVSLSYRAETRPEAKSAKIRSIINSGRTELEAIYRPLLAELPYVSERGEGFEDLRKDIERTRARRGTLHALNRSKWSAQSWRYIWRNYKSHSSPLRYLGMKVVGEFEKALKRISGKQVSG